MIFSLAPMEGLTGHTFRAVHARCFGVLDRYYTPFLAPPHLGSGFGKRALRELDSGVNEGLDVVPQLLTNDADRFVRGATVLAEMGFREVNLNLGCPSGTVVAKGRGSGMLRDLDALDAFLGQVCAESPLPVSVKTRIGVVADEEYEQILAVYLRHPLAELIVHPRVQRDRYEGSPRQEAYGRALAAAPFPVAYNGDIFDRGDLDALCAAYPTTRHVMLGRGVLANPALARMFHGGAPATRAEFERFHDELFEAYLAEMGGNAVFRMKEWWSYARCAFANPLSVHRRVRKARTVEDYRAAARGVFCGEELAATPRFSW